MKKTLGALLVLGFFTVGCGGEEPPIPIESRYPGVSNLEGRQPDSLTLYEMGEGIPNIARICIDEAAFLGIEGVRDFILRVEAWDDQCLDKLD